MTHGDAIELIRDLLGTRDTLGTWSSTTLYRLLNVACRQVWQDVIFVTKGRVAETAYVTYTANALGVDIYSGAEATKLTRLMQLLGVWTLPYAGSALGEQPATPVLPKDAAQVEDYQAGRLLIDPEVYYTHNANQIQLRPIPDSVTYLMLKVLLLPAELAATDDATVQLLAGALPGIHDVIVYKACYLASVKVREAALQFQELAREAWTAALPFLSLSGRYPLEPERVSADE